MFTFLRVGLVARFLTGFVTLALLATSASSEFFQTFVIIIIFLKQETHISLPHKQIILYIFMCSELFVN
jgi:hypothetical protein